MTRPAVLVTGGAHRIGAAIARRFGTAGWHVVIHCNQSRDAAEQLADELPSAEVEQCNLAEHGEGTAMIARLAKRLEDWRVLVNSASVFPPDDVEQMEPEVFTEVMQVNAKAPVRMAQAFLQQARSQGGRRVIHLTDQKLANPNPDFFSYTMSKFALSASVAMMDMVAEGEDRIYEIAPGAILASHDQSPEEAEISHRMNLLGRRTGVDEVAEAAFFLATGPLGGGQRLLVDSGQHLLRQKRDVMYLGRIGEQP
jgi:NAD(P)-dependent dehydrogenase (short-subunit alcohol dehydrogenase family)